MTTAVQLTLDLFWVASPQKWLDTERWLVGHAVPWEPVFATRWRGQDRAMCAFLFVAILFHPRLLCMKD